MLVDAGMDMGALKPDPESNAAPAVRRIHFRLPPGVTPGIHTLTIAVGDASGTPRIALPLPGNDERERRYALGTLTVQ